MRKKTDLIVGFGEIGKSLYKILRKKYTVNILDIEPEAIVTHDVNVMHVCFPYTASFVKEIKRYRKMYKPAYIVIHSTVPIGTSKKLECFYSPVRGVHPHLEKSLQIFIKYLAPNNKYLVNYFKNAGIKIKSSADTNSLEAMKLYCTTVYGMNIIIEKEIWNFCKTNGLDFNTVYTDCNLTYNDGYKKLGFPQFSKYVLKHVDGKIGGHCIIPNCKLLNTDSARFIARQNKKL